MTSKYSLSEFRVAVSTAGEILRGHVGSGEIAEYVLPLVFLKFLCDFSKQKKKTSKFQKYNFQTIDFFDEKNYDYSYPSPIFDSFLDLSKEPRLGNRLNSAFYFLEQKFPDELGGVFKLIDFNSLRLGSDSKRSDTLTSLIESIAQINFGDGSETEDFQKAGDLFTLAVEVLSNYRNRDANVPPNEVSTLIARIINLHSSERIYDPNCGTGSFLIECVKNIPSQSPSQVCGFEKNASLWSVSRMNSFIHSVDSRCIQHGDPFDDSDFIQSSKFHAVVSFPSWGKKELLPKHWNWNSPALFGIEYSKLNKEYAIILHSLSCLDYKTGRSAFLLPTGSLSKAGVEQKLRHELVRENLLDAVISLPERMLHGSRISMSVLVLKMVRSKKDVLFVKSSKEDDIIRGQNRLTTDEVEKIVSAYENFSEDGVFSIRVSSQEIESNQYNLQPGLYFAEEMPKLEVSIDEIKSKRAGLKTEIEILDKKILDLQHRAGIFL